MQQNGALEPVMPMSDCSSPGLVEAAPCCLHIASSLKESTRCEVGFVFDDLGDGYVLCAACLVVAREYVREHRTETINAYPVEITFGCIEHLWEWGRKVNKVNLHALLRSARKRTGQRPER